MLQILTLFILTFAKYVAATGSAFGAEWSLAPADRAGKRGTRDGARAAGSPRARSAKVDSVLREERAQAFEDRARFNDQAIPPDRIVL